MLFFYRVSFFKSLVDSNGHPAEPCQGTLEVRAPSEHEALVKAKRRFAEIKGVRDWTMRADRVDAQLMRQRRHIGHIAAVHRS